MNKTKYKKLLTRLKSIHPLIPTIILLFVGGPLTAVGAFFIWRTHWSQKNKIIITIVFSVVLNIGLLFFNGYILGYLIKKY